MKAAVWLRVSTGSQDAQNQRAALEAEAERRGLEIVRWWILDGVSARKGEHQAALAEVVREVRGNRFRVLVCWALDRLARGGVADTLATVKRIEDAGALVVSLHEPWLSVDGPARELLLSVMGWAAGMEARRISERTKAGLERRRAAGVRLGRPLGAKDKRPRRRDGYWRKQRGDAAPYLTFR